MRFRLYRTRWALPAACLVIIALVFINSYVYMRYIRPWQLRWGATDVEVARDMPGDEIVADPTFDATRAVTVDATPEDIWPWIVQMGFGRAGWYSYDWIDNLGRPSARVILPELQRIDVGDMIPIDPREKHGFRVKGFVPNEWMLWGDGHGKITWCWGLYPIDDRSTRLVTRVKVKYDWLNPTMLFNMVFDVGDIVMMRKCLIGIRERAEIPARSPGLRL
jgi:hypothetical protein